MTAHHLLLCDRDVVDANWKMNPPLRGEADRKALIRGLQEGALSLIANDHAPHSEEEKKRPLEAAPFGIVSLETAFPLLYTKLVLTGIVSLKQLVNWDEHGAGRALRPCAPRASGGRICERLHPGGSQRRIHHQPKPFPLQGKEHAVPRLESKGKDQSDLCRRNMRI